MEAFAVVLLTLAFCAAAASPFFDERLRIAIEYFGHSFFPDVGPARYVLTPFAVTLTSTERIRRETLAVELQAPGLLTLARCNLYIGFPLFR